MTTLEDCRFSADQGFASRLGPGVLPWSPLLEGENNLAALSLELSEST